jgi:hypothetical protein
VFGLQNCHSEVDLIWWPYTIGYKSYLECTIGQSDLIWQPCIGSTSGGDVSRSAARCHCHSRPGVKRFSKAFANARVERFPKRYFKVMKAVSRGVFQGLQEEL